jgi:hypothetical protein
VSRDRESTADSSTPGPQITSQSSNIRFRNQSPSTSNRRSRERERINRDGKESLNQSLDMTADHLDGGYHDDSARLDMLGYPSLNSEDLEYTDSEHKLHLMSTPSSNSRPHRTNSLQAIDRLATKISCTKENISREQKARDGKIKQFLFCLHKFEIHRFHF